MNQKGLTMIELLAVIVILSAVALMIVPNAISSISRSNERLLETQIDDIKSAAKNWAIDKIDKDGCVAETCNNSGQDSGAVTLRQLQDGGYIADDLSNPKTGNKFNPDTVMVIINYEGNDYVYSVEGITN